jgi:hypothetical protein
LEYYLSGSHSSKFQNHHCLWKFLGPQEFNPKPVFESDFIFSKPEETFKKHTVKLLLAIPISTWQLKSEEQTV